MPPDHPQREGKIVVAGGSGLIGQALCAALSAAGVETVVLSRDARRRIAGARTVAWDPSTPVGPWVNELRGAHALVNLCGNSIAGGRWTGARKQALVQSRVGPARTLIEAMTALDRRPAMLLQASGVGYVGTGDAPTDETADPGHDFLAELAVAWETTLTAAPVPAAALRFGVVLARGGALPRMLLPFRGLVGGPLGNGRQWLSWIHLDDAVAAIRFVLDQRLAGPVNVTAPAPVQNEEFAAIASRVLGRPCWLRTPALALRLALGEQATLVLDGQRALPRRLTEAGFRFRYPTLDRALADLCR